MSTTGGNWKEFWLAASQPGGGDLELLKFHLKNGVDPNYQHPEMESTALCEAIVAGNVQIVEFLLKYKGKDGKLAVDPTIPSAYENQTPLEIAMEIQHHVIVDMILEALMSIDNYAEESKHCQQILVSVPTSNTNVLYSNYVTNITERALQLGHMVVSASSPIIMAEEDNNNLSLQAYYQKETGNAKFWPVPSLDGVPSLLASSSEASKIAPTKIDTWFCFLSLGGINTKDESILDLIESEFIKPSKKIASEHWAPKQVWLGVPSTFLATAYNKQQMISSLKHFEAQLRMQKSLFQVNAVVIPCSWWDNMWRGSSSSWIDMEVLGRLLKIYDYPIVNGSRIFNHKLEEVHWAKITPDLDTSYCP